MNTRQIQAHRYYKSLYSNALILYHFSGYYMALGNDADSVSRYLTVSKDSEPGIVRFVDDKNNISALSKNGFKICIVQCHNNNGIECFPDVSQIIADKEIDY